MLVESLLNLLYSVFSLLTTPISIPQLPETVTESMNTFFDYVQAGVGILAAYTHIGYLLVLFGIIIAVDIGILLYKFVMWVIKKIPFLGIE